MSQVKLLKIASDGVPLEFDSSADEITLLSGKFGNIKAAGNSVTSEDTDGDLNLTPNGAGNLVLDGLKWPQSDGSAGFFLKTDGAGQLSFAAQADDVDAEYLSDTYTAAVALSARDAVYISAADSVSKAAASAAGTAQCIGFASASALITAPVNVRKMGQLSGFSGLTPGARQFLSATAGAITETIPSTTGHTIVQVGYAKSATVLDIRIENMGRRA